MDLGTCCCPLADVAFTLGLMHAQSQQQQLSDTTYTLCLFANAIVA